MRTQCLLLFLTAGLFACGHASHENDAAELGTAASDATHDHGDGAHVHDQGGATMTLLDGAVWDHFGHGVHAGDTLPLADVLADPSRFVGEAVRIGGPILQVCQDTGCWLRLGTEDANMMVRLKDRAFTMPKDARGEAVVEGVLTVEEVSVELRKLALEQAGKPDEAAKVTAPGTKASFTATGVAIAKGE